MPSDHPDSDGEADGDQGRPSTGDATQRTDAADARSATDAPGASGTADGQDDRGATASTDVPTAPPGRHDSGAEGPTTDAETPNTVLNAIIGGVVTTVTAMFLGPFSPAVGGGAAGYLEGGETNDGLKVGAFAGIVALVPILLFLPLLLLVVPVFGPRGGIAFLFVMVFVISILGAYVLGLSALGGVLGAYLKRER